MATTEQKSNIASQSEKQKIAVLALQPSHHLARLVRERGRTIQTLQNLITAHHSNICNLEAECEEWKTQNEERRTLIDAVVKENDALKFENITLKTQLKAQEETFLARKAKIILQVQELHRKQIEHIAAQANEIEFLMGQISTKEQSQIQQENMVHKQLEILESMYKDEQATMADIMKAREEAHQQEVRSLREAHEGALREALAVQSQNNSGKHPSFTHISQEEAL
jgi:delta 1-pyrroline-5-carboxylate dehydrogenase